MNGLSPHLSSLGLSRHPFPPSPDAQCYFFTDALEREFAEILHCIESRKGFLLLTGEVGMGKTTFIRRVLLTLSEREIPAALVFNTFLQGRELLLAISRDFGLEPQSDLAADVEALNRFLIEQHRNGKTVVVIIDDAQNLSIESLELLRLLSNLETGQGKLLQIVLTGQPELLNCLDDPKIRQLTSRIAKHVSLTGLSKSDAGRYIEFRLADAGAQGRIRLTESGLKALYLASGGNPRQMHAILDRCLYGLLVRRSREIDVSLVKKAANEVKIGLPIKPLVGATFSLPRLAWSASLLASLVLAVIASSNFRLPLFTASAHAVTPRPSQDSPAVAAISPRQQCIQRLGLAGTAVNIMFFALPSSLADKVHETNNTCLLQEHGEKQVIWNSSWQSSDFLTGLKQRNETVRRLQTALMQLGFLQDQDVDGLFGPRSQYAVTQLQQSHGLDATGKPDNSTLLLIEQLVSSVAKASPRGVEGV